MMLIDTHCHLDFPEFEPDREKVIEKAREEGVVCIINVGTDADSTEKCLVLAEKYDNCFATAGIHPHQASKMKDAHLDRLSQLAREGKIVAIGETGLDYHYGREYLSCQKDLFRFHINLATELNLPLIVHQRESQDDVVRILQESNLQVSVIFHCFSGDRLILQYAWENHFYCSFAGNITFKSAEPIREAARSLPESLLMVETDAPYLSPEPYRGKRNEPGRVKLVAEALAAVREEEPERMFTLLFRNAIDFFRLKEKGF